MHSLATHAATRWVASGLLAVGGWALYQSATAQTTPAKSIPPAETADHPPDGANAPDPAASNGAALSEPPAEEAAQRHPARHDQVDALVSNRLRAERNHLWRVAAWGTANVVGGVALRAASDRPDTRGFGTQSAMWGAVNMGIAAAGLLGTRSRPDAWRDAVDAERRYHDILLANLGLNVGYASVGTAMVIAGAQDVDRAEAWQGHGSALIVQGAGLFLLDTIAWLGSRRRIVRLLGISGDLAARPLPMGAALTWRF